MAPITLVLGNRTYSSWSYRAWLCLRKSGVEFEDTVLPLDTPEFSARIGDLSPTRRVPVLWHGDLCIWDSLAICEYINEQFADGRLWPADPADRALGRCMAAEMHSGFPDLRTDMPMNFRAHGRRIEITQNTRADIDRVFALWTDSLGQHAQKGPWLLGEYSIADAMFAPVVVRLRNYGVDVPAHLEPYVQQHRGRSGTRVCGRISAAAETWVVEQDEAGA